MTCQTCAMGVFDGAKTEQEAALVLLRRNEEGWPHSLLRLAVDGGQKRFLAHPFVQALVDEAWRGSKFVRGSNRV